MAEAALKRIDRDPARAARKSYDAIIIGGGVYGLMLALEASARNLAVLILEKTDFGASTSYNSLKIVHGGLRHLQNLNLSRYRQFVGERRWFLENFPDLVDPLPVLMPLYQEGLRRIETLWGAFFVDRLLSYRRNRGMPAEKTIPAGRIVSPEEVKKHFGIVRQEGLKGGALWYDAHIEDTQRLLMRILRCAVEMGAVALNYMPAVDLIEHEGRVIGVRARDERLRLISEYASPIVINTTGPWSRETARRFDRDIPDLFRPSLAWNILFDREALSEHALALAPPGANSQLFFAHPWKNRLLIGTGHAIRTKEEASLQPTSEELDQFLSHLNEAVPALRLSHRDILHVFAGFLPVRKEGTVRLSKKDGVFDHSKHGGPAGFFSVRSTRLTASRSNAQKVLEEIFPDRSISVSIGEMLKDIREKLPVNRGRFSYDWRPRQFDSAVAKSLGRIIEEEAVFHLDDLILRRTTIGDNPSRSIALAPEISSLFEWDNSRQKKEIQRIKHHFRWITS